MGSNSLANPITKRLEGKVTVITGGASGIGETTARLFVWHGAKVVIADIQYELGHSFCQGLGSDQNTVSYIHCDVTCESDARNAVDLAVSKYGKLDIMYNNAGITGVLVPRILEYSSEQIKRVFDVNLFGVFLAAKHAARIMIPAKKGCIIFTSSLASVLAGEAVCHAYVASKHAFLGLAKNLTVELGKHGIRVNCISPFPVATPMTMKAMGNIQKKKLKEIFSSLGTLKGAVQGPEETAEAALYLASNESKYVSGINLVIDGGYSLDNPTFWNGLRSML